MSSVAHLGRFFRTDALSALESEESEQQFLAEYRGTSLVWAMYASAFGSVLFASFLVISWLYEPHSTLAILIRVGLVVGLASITLALWARRLITVGNYVRVASCAVSVVLGLTVILPALQDFSGSGTRVEASPAIMIGVFVMYTLLRLPLRLSLMIGLASGAVSIVLAPVVAGGSETMRALVYALAVNLLGAYVSRLIETRERELFVQRRSAERARQVASERQLVAEEASRQKTRLIASVSHDLRQPMTASLAYLDIMIRRLANGDLVGSRAQAQKAQSALSLLGSTLDHLLTAARYESGSEALDVQATELRPLLQDLYEAHIPDAERRRVELRMVLPRRLPVLHTDARALHRVLGNLISNAIKFNVNRDGGGRVLVAVRLRGDRCRIDVFDTGIGISPESLSEIWKPYVQLNNSERDRERGLGLGLFLVQTVIEQLPDHTIEMASTLGRGSRFTVTLPVVRLDAPAHRPPLAALSTAEFGVALLAGTRAVVLEDDRDTRLAIVALVEEWGISAVAAGSMSELLSRHLGGKSRVDTIICDYRLAGGTNGIDAIAGLRHWLGYAPLAVLITGEPDIDPLRERAGPDTVVLQKPFVPEALARPLLEAAMRAECGSWHRSPVHR